MNLIYSLNAFDHFDAVQVISDYQYNEMIEIKKKRKLKLKIFKSKYLFIEKKIQILQKNKFSTDILIAPSWNSNFYSSKCHLILNEKLKNKGVTFKLRPHPMSFKNGETSLSELKKEEIQIDRDIFLNFQNYNFLISDWSGIFIEYALIFKKKAFLINTPKKMVNENYLIYENEPIEISLRNVFAKNFEIDKIPQMVEEIIIQKNSNESPQNEEIKKIIKNKFY